MHYLIRDEAATNRPIIGIAALGNAILGLNQRDDALGWSIRSLARRLDEGIAAERNTRSLTHLLNVARDEVSKIYTEDFALDGLSHDQAVRYLERIEAQANSARTWLFMPRETSGPQSTNSSATSTTRSAMAMPTV